MNSDKQSLEPNPPDAPVAPPADTSGWRTPGAGRDSGCNGHWRDRANDPIAAAPFDAWALIEPLLAHWRWLALGGAAVAFLALCAGLWRWDVTYTATAQLIRYESPNNEEVFRPRQVAPQTFALMLRAPELIRRVSARAQPPIDPGAMARRLRVVAERNSDLLSVAVSDRDPQRAVDLANLHASEAVRFTQELQAKAAAEVEQYLTQQLADVEAKLDELDAKWASLPVVTALPASGPVSASLPVSRPYSLLARRAAAKEELADLLTRYTDAHPTVQQARAKLAAIEQQLTDKERESPPENAETTAGAGPATGKAASAQAAESGKNETAPPDPEVLRTQLQSLENARLSLATRARAAQLFQTSPPGYHRLFAPASMEGTLEQHPALKIAALTFLGAVLGVVAAAALVLFAEFTGRRLCTARDVARVTGLPVLAVLGDLNKLDSKSRDRCAFRAWAALQNRLSPSPNHGLICGVISAGHGEGRSTWLRLLAEAASQRGFRVLTVATRPSPPAAEADENQEPRPFAADDSVSTATALTSNALAAPAAVTERLTGPNPQPLVHIPLPGWVWNLERRKQWQSALAQWRKIDNLVILVELPPASVPEAVLLAENLPNLVWLADSGKADAETTCEELQTLRHARCHLVGAVVNRAQDMPWRHWFPRWLNPFSQQPA